jgi:hypothetical protein
VISPSNRTFPPHFTPGRITPTYIKKQLGGGQGAQNNKQDVYLNISSPYAGYWFSAAFVDTNDQKVKPDFLKANCSFYLTASVSLVQINDTQVLYPNRTLQSPPHAMFTIYKYLSTGYDGPLTFEVSFAEPNHTCRLVALLRQSAFPDMNTFTKNNAHTLCEQNVTTHPVTCQPLTLNYPMMNTWYYVAVSSDCAYQVNVVLPLDCVKETQMTLALFNETFPTALMNNNYHLLNPAKLSQYCAKLVGPIETFRFIGPTYFSVKYYFNSNYNRSNALLVRNDRKPYFIEFLVDLANNGGTLSIYIVNNLIFDPSFDQSRATTTTPSTSTTASATKSSNSTQFAANSSAAALLSNENIEQQMRYFNTFRANGNDVNLADVKIVLHACLLFNSMTAYENCPEGYKVSVQSFTNVFSNIQMNVAYPMMGKWYLAIWKECFNVNSK